MVIVSHPTGNANVRHAASGLQKSGLLGEFWTCLAPSERNWLMRLLPAKAQTRFLRRELPFGLRKHVRTRPWRELGRFAANTLNCSFLTRHEVGWCSVDGVYRDLDGAVASRVRKGGGIRAVYGYEDGSLETFRAASETGLKRIYDLPIAYWKVGRKIFLEEAEREPEWKSTLDGLGDSEDKLARKDEEIRLADCILVASSFTKASLVHTGRPSSDVHVIPYGAPTSLVEPQAFRKRRSDILRVLFVGSLGQRKGTSYLLRACDLLGPRVGLTLIGNRPPGHCAPLDVALRKHRWIPSCRHEQVLEEMRNHDVLVFPSLFEGFGLVILEAMSQGMTVITTPNTGGPDVITDGENGFIVPIRSAEAIAERLETLVFDRKRLASMKNAALDAARVMSWANYEHAVAGVVKSLLPNR
ncbi:MAG: glycosyltransferase family 4 protein [Terrimicrobiaceae bacterium]|nr:glycosyltransferase family 4 protein [Terrimicrobiaceae bacterium]